MLTSHPLGMMTRVVVLMLVVAGAAHNADGEKSLESANGAARATAAKHYEPTWESLSRHGAAPQWYRDSVFGIYFHWGVYSVPAYGGEKYYRSMYRPGRRWRSDRRTPEPFALRPCLGVYHSSQRFY